MRKTATAIVRGLLLQLVQQHPSLIEHLLPKYEERGATAFNSFDALLAMFMKAAAGSATGRKYCIVDVLDESELDSRITLLKQIKETFGQGRLYDRLNSLGNRLYGRYVRTGAIAYLEEAVSIVRQAFEAMPANHPEIEAYLNNIGAFLGPTSRR